MDYDQASTVIAALQPDRVRGGWTLLTCFAQYRRANIGRVSGWFLTENEGHRYILLSGWRYGV